MANGAFGQENLKNVRAEQSTNRKITGERSQKHSKVKKAK